MPGLGGSGSGRVPGLGGGGCLVPGGGGKSGLGVPAPRGGCLVDTPQTASAAGGTHPTRMHSC